MPQRHSGASHHPGTHGMRSYVRLFNMGFGAAFAGAGTVMAMEICVPMMLLCMLCCWPDGGSDSSSSGHPRKPVLVNEGSRRSSGLRGRILGSSAVSLHLPGTSGSPSLAARSHDDLTLARLSAPEVIREVLTRRDWDRSARELFIPLRPDPETFSSPRSPRSPVAPRATPDDLDPPCKKHHTNIKGRKELRAAPPERDEESPSSFFIGDNEETELVERPVCSAKQEKQCMNESIRCKERPWRLAAAGPGLPGLAADEVDAMDALAAAPGALASRDSLETTPDVLDTTPDSLDRSGAVHHALDSRAAADMGYVRIVPLSPLSVDVVGYEYEGGGYGDETDRFTLVPTGTMEAPGVSTRARHASDGDILGPAPRPESGAFSESDLDLELRLALQAEQLQEREEYGVREPLSLPRPTRTDRRETAI